MSSLVFSTEIFSKQMPAVCRCQRFMFAKLWRNERKASASQEVTEERGSLCFLRREGWVKGREEVSVWVPPTHLSVCLLERLRPNYSYTSTKNILVLVNQSRETVQGTNIGSRGSVSICKPSLLSSWKNSLLSSTHGRTGRPSQYVWVLLSRWAVLNYG